MATEPFSGQDYELPITSENYVSEIQGNFALTKTEMRSLFAQISSGQVDASFFDAGILEMNGHFQLTRLLNKLVPHVGPFPLVPQDVISTTNFEFLDDGDTLGYAGTKYTYHPSQAVGWYFAKELVAGDTDFGEYVGDDEDIFKLTAKNDARVDDPTIEDRPVLYQPVSVHLPRHRWADKNLTIKLKYKCGTLQGARIYVVWSGGVNGRVKQVDTAFLQDTLGNFDLLQLPFKPDADAQYLEFGIEFISPNPVAVEMEYFIMTDNPNRYAGGVKTAAMLALQVGMGQRYYCQYNTIKTTGGYVYNSADILATGVDVQDAMPLRCNQPMIVPGAASHYTSPVLWPLADYYSKEAFCQASAGHSAFETPIAQHKWQRTADNVSVWLNPSYHSVNIASALLSEDMRQHYAVISWDVLLHYTTSATNIRRMIPVAPSTGFAEVVNNFPPLFT